MELPIVEPSEIPLPPEGVRITDLEIDPYPDGRRLKLALTLTPFQQPPDIDVEFTTEQHGVGASASVVNPTHPKLTMTLHLRTPENVSKGLLTVSIRYEQTGIVDRVEKQVLIRNIDAGGRAGEFDAEA